MKKLFKIFILLFVPMVLVQIKLKSASAIEKGIEYIGFLKLDPRCLVVSGTEGNHVVSSWKWRKIGSNKVMAIYSDKYGTGPIETTTTVSYSIFNETTGETVDKTTSWELGGNYAKCFLENDMVGDCYYFIKDLGVPYCDDSEFDGSIDGYEYNSKEEAKYIGELPTKYETEGFKLYQEGQTLVLKAGTPMNEDDFMNLVDVAGSSYFRTVSLSTNYKPEVGNYYADYTVRGVKTDYSYTRRLNIEVIADFAPVINGPSTVSVKHTESDGYTVEKFLSNYSATYGNQSYTLSLSEEQTEIFYNSIASGGAFNLDVIATFSGGRKARRTVTLKYIDDVEAEFYVKNLVLDKDVFEAMDISEILEYIEAQLASKTNGLATNVYIFRDEYSGNEDKVGSFNVSFSYDINDVNYTATLKINNNPDKKVNKGLIIASSILVLVSGGIITAVVIKNKRKHRV